MAKSRSTDLAISPPHRLPHIHTEADLDVGLAALGAIDPRFVPVIAQTGRPPLRRRAHGYAGLAAIIVSQQLSTASAGAIWGRLTAAFDPFEPAALMRARPARLGAAWPFGRQNSRTQGDRARPSTRATSISEACRHAGGRSARRADRPAGCRPLDRRHLSARLPRARRRLAGRRSRPAGGRAHCLWVARAADDQGDASAGGPMAAMALHSGARPVVVLSHR